MHQTASGPYPLEPRFVERVWGTTKLSPYYPDAGVKIGEVWFTPSESYPVLVKFIFTSERLSVQVHPDDIYARKHEQSCGKTEMWHILAAKPGASIAIGFRENVSKEQLRAAVADGSVTDLLNWIPVSAGQTYFTSAGIVHAIGAGVTLCEIQQNSDVTYRLYDYGRGRELHLDKGFEVLETGEYQAARKMPVRCEHFVTEALSAGPGEVLNIDSECLLVALSGTGTINGRAYRLGEVWHVPQGSNVVDVRFDVGAEMLRVRCGDGAHERLAVSR
jgi:mannose-6-phosphate isomerase